MRPPRPPREAVARPTAASPPAFWGSTDGALMCCCDERPAVLPAAAAAAAASASGGRGRLSPPPPPPVSISQLQLSNLLCVVLLHVTLPLPSFAPPRAQRSPVARRRAPRCAALRPQQHTTYAMAAVYPATIIFSSSSGTPSAEQDARVHACVSQVCWHLGPGPVPPPLRGGQAGPLYSVARAWRRHLRCCEERESQGRLGACGGPVGIGRAAAGAWHLVPMRPAWPRQRTCARSLARSLAGPHLHATRPGGAPLRWGAVRAWLRFVGC